MNQETKRVAADASVHAAKHNSSNLYRYALEGYAHSIPPGSSNDDGSIGWSSLNRQSLAPPPPSSIPSFRNEHVQHQRVQYSHPFQFDMPDATYEEIYGEAYTGGTIKYIYPSGYQNMRPRSGPWKLSIAVTILFFMLSIFIVGHCSDQVEYDSNTIDDDTLVIDVRWCGSRPLYLMWVASMLVTGLAAAYCSVIGYIKIRDFAVANSRSQPPGILDGKSDYYVSSERNIYQADGEPQFWGSQIYRPTQAAVAVTSR